MGSNFPSHAYRLDLVIDFQWIAFDKPNSAWLLSLGELDSILKSRDITLLTKVHKVNAIVFPAVMYRCESWTIKKAERKRIDGFELWCWRRLLRVPWTARRSNQSILKKIKCDYIKKQRHYFVNKGPSSQGDCFSSSHVWIWDLDYQESWALKSWCFWTVVLKKTLESPLDCKEIQPVHPKGNHSRVFIGKSDVEAETPIFWPPDAKSWLIWKDRDAGKDWGQEKKGKTENETVG